MPANPLIVYEIVWGVVEPYGWGVGLRTEAPDRERFLDALDYAQALYRRRQREEPFLAVIHPDWLPDVPDVGVGGASVIIAPNEQVGQDYLVFVTGRSVLSEIEVLETT